MRNVYQFIWIMPPLMKNQRAAFLKLSGNDCGCVKIMEQLKDIYEIKGFPTALLKIQSAFASVWQSKCCKLFHAYLNQTANEYLTAYRLDKGCELLCSTDRTVSEIALEVGFSGGSYFAEVFRKGFGQSPTEFRKRERDSV